MEKNKLEQQAETEAEAEAKVESEAKETSKTKEELLEEQNKLLQEEISVLKQQLDWERRKPVSSRSIYDMVCYYGCPNSKRVKKLQTMKKKR